MDLNLLCSSCGVCPTEVAVTLSSGGNQVAETASGPELITMLEMPLRMLQCGGQELVSHLWFVRFGPIRSYGVFLTTIWRFGGFLFHLPTDVAWDSEYGHAGGWVLEQAVPEDGAKGHEATGEEHGLHYVTVVSFCELLWVEMSEREKFLFPFFMTLIWGQ